MPTRPRPQRRSGCRRAPAPRPRTRGDLDRSRRALGPLGIPRVGSVDKFQGLETPIVILSCTSSSPEDAPPGLAFFYDPHRFNVATSRAQSPSWWHRRACSRQRSARQNRCAGPTAWEEAGQLPLQGQPEL
ncbi:MAG: AAA domain-containing protein [Planctomycetota bacterium]